jgi:L-asparagine oxygenase
MRPTPVITPSNEYVLTHAEARHLRDVALRAARHLPAEIGALDRYLLEVPQGIHQAIGDLMLGAHSSGFQLIRGLDIGEVPVTPNGHANVSLWEHPTTGILALVASILGQLIGYADEKSGALIHDVLPVRGEETRIENSGAVSFDFHTENVHHPLRPDFLALLCLRQDHDRTGATRVASARHAVELLDDEQVAILRRPEFRSLYPTSFTRNRTDERPVSNPHPVLFGPDAAPFMRFNTHNTHATESAARRALDALTVALEHVCVDLVLEPGELVIIDNHVAAHGRSAFVPRYDGADRWLRRCYVVNAAPRWISPMMPKPNVLPAIDQFPREL